MRYIICFYILLLTLSFISNGQELENYQKEYPYYSFPSGNSLDLSMKLNDQKFLIIRKSGSLITCYDTKLTELYSLKSEADYFPKLIRLDEGDRFGVLLTNKKKKLYTTVLQIHNALTGEVIRNKEIYSGQFYPTLYSSENNKFFSLNVFDTKSNEVKTLVFDNRFELVRDTRIEFDKKENYKSYILSSDGLQYFTFLNSKTKDIRIVECSRPDDQNEYMFDTGLKSLSIPHIVSFIQNSELRLVLLSNEGKSYSQYFVYNIDLKAKSHERFDGVKLDKNSLSKLYDKIDDEQVVDGKVKKQNYFSSPSKPVIHKNKDGSFITITEQLYYKKYQRDSRTERIYHAKDILVSKFNNRLENVWNQIIVKSAEARSGFANEGIGFANIKSKSFSFDNEILLVTNHRVGLKYGLYYRSINIDDGFMSIPNLLLPDEGIANQNFTLAPNKNNLVFMTTDRLLLTRNYVLRSVTLD